MKTKVNDKSIWNEIYEKEEFSPGWASPGLDKNLLAIVSNEIKTKVLDSCKILDIGCGNGRNSMVVEALEGVDLSYTGVDFADKAIDYCKETYIGGKEFKHLDMTASNLPLDKNYNIIMDCGCFHSIPPESRDLYVNNLHKLGTKDTLIIIGAWFRAPEHIETKKPSYFPYLYLDEWFFNKEDISNIFGDRFNVISEQVDDKIYDGINKGFAYFSLRVKS